MLIQKNHQSVMCLVSDSKKDLEKQLDENDEEAEVSKRSKRPLQESDVDNADSVSLPKKRKEHKDSVKKQKAAAVATANEIAKHIFQERNTSVINYSETQKQQHLQEIKKLTDKVKELSEKLEDKESSIEAKRVVVSNLEEKVKELKEENMQLRCELDRSKCNAHNTTGKYIICQYYSTKQHLCICSILDYLW